MTDASLTHRARAALVLAASPRRPSASRPTLANPAALREQAPADYKAKFDTTKGALRHRACIATGRRNGADRFYNLRQERLLRQRPLLPRDHRLHGAVRHQRRSEGLGAVARCARSRTIRSCRATAAATSPSRWRARTPAPARCSSTSARTAASTARASRRSAAIVSGMEVVDKLNAEYGEGAPRGRGPTRRRVQMEGNAYLAKDFRRLDYVVKRDHREVAPMTTRRRVSLRPGAAGGGVAGRGRSPHRLRRKARSTPWPMSGRALRGCWQWPPAERGPRAAWN